MMDQFVIWQLQGVRYLCLRNPNDYYMLERIKRMT